MKLYAGLDVHSKMTVFVVQNKKGELIAQGKVPTTEAGLAQMVASVALPRGTAVALETGSQAKWVDSRLKALGLSPVVFEARHVHSQMQRQKQKCDSRDARELCEGLRTGRLSVRVWMPSESIDHLRRLYSRRNHFVRHRTSQINAAKFLLRARGLERPRLLRSVANWERMLEREDLQDKELQEHLRMHQRVWQVLDEQVCSLEQQIIEALASERELSELLMSVPGVGPLIAGGFIAALGEAHRFESSAQVVSYLGLCPSSDDSGDRKRHGSITKCGNALARTLLVEGAQHARLATHPLHPYWARAAARHGVKKANVAIAQRMARILWRVWRDKAGFDLGKLGVVRTSGTIEKKIYYRLKWTEQRGAKMNVHK